MIIFNGYEKYDEEEQEAIWRDRYEDFRTDNKPKPDDKCEPAYIGNPLPLDYDYRRTEI